VADLDDGDDVAELREQVGGCFFVGGGRGGGGGFLSVLVHIRFGV
jgi:hypothetical protein